jgi:Predicted membrane protein
MTASFTVPSSVFTGFIFAAAAELAVPIVLLAVLCLKKKVNVKPMFLGFAAFFVSQICIRIPILQILGTKSWFTSFVLNTIPYVIMLSVTAGLFEESARYLCAGCFLKKDRLFRDAVSFGLGHGFCEVILLTGMGQINNIVYSVMISSGTLGSAVPAETAKQILTAMQAIRPEEVYLGVLERVFAVTFHIFASVMIFKGVNEHKVGFYLLAVLAHSAFNIGGVLLTKYVSLWAGEGCMFILALAALFLILKMKPSFPAAEPEIPPVQQIT